MLNTSSDNDNGINTTNWIFWVKEIGIEGSTFQVNISSCTVPNVNDLKNAIKKLEALDMVNRLDINNQDGHVVEGNISISELIIGKNEDHPIYFSRTPPSIGKYILYICFNTVCTMYLYCCLYY